MPEGRGDAGGDGVGEPGRAGGRPRPQHPGLLSAEMEAVSRSPTQTRRGRAEKKPLAQCCGRTQCPLGSGSPEGWPAGARDSGLAWDRRGRRKGGTQSATEPRPQPVPEASHVPRSGLSFPGEEGGNLAMKTPCFLRSGARPQTETRRQPWALSLGAAVWGRGVLGEPAVRPLPAQGARPWVPPQGAVPPPPAKQMGCGHR